MASAIPPQFFEKDITVYERFTDRARKVMQIANQKAQGLNHEYIGTEHIVLAFVADPGSGAAALLTSQNVTLEAVRLAVQRRVQSGPEMVTMGKLPHTPRAKKVIEYAMNASRGLNHNYVGTEHLLLGTLKEEEGCGFLALKELGITYDATLERFIEVLQAQKGESVEFSSVHEDVSSAERKLGASIIGMLRRSGLTRKEAWSLGEAIQRSTTAGIVANMLLSAKPQSDNLAEKTDASLISRFGSTLGAKLLHAVTEDSNLPQDAAALAKFFETAELDRNMLNAAMFLARN